MTFGALAIEYASPRGCIVGKNGWQVVHKFGRNPDIGTSAWEDIVSFGGAFPWWSTAQYITAVSDSTDDAAGGSGARKIILSGLGEDWHDQVEEIEMNGTSVVATTKRWMRFFRAYVSETGTYATSTAGSNAGAITVSLSGGAQIGEIEHNGTFGLGQTQLGVYTVPADKVAYMKSLQVLVTTNKPAEIIGWFRPGADNTASNITARRVFKYIDGAQGPTDRSSPTPPRFAAKTDIWFSAIGGSASTAIAVDFELYLRGERYPGE